MAEQQVELPAEGMPEQEQEEDESGPAPGYKAPAKASMQELMEKDKEDESLRKYKASLGITENKDTIFCKALFTNFIFTTSHLHLRPKL